jgi:hypothetical protein
MPPVPNQVQEVQSMRVPIMAGAAWLAVVLALAGCSGGPAGASVPVAESAAAESAVPPAVESSPDAIAGSGQDSGACELLAPGEIAGVIGNPVADGDATTRSDCSWGSDPDATSVAVLLLAAPASICDSTLAADAAQQPVDGLGSPAYWTWVAVSGGVGTLSLCTTAEMVTITVSAGLEDTPDESSLQAQAKTLAQLLLPRM